MSGHHAPPGTSHALLPAYRGPYRESTNYRYRWSVELGSSPCGLGAATPGLTCINRDRGRCSGPSQRNSSEVRKRRFQQTTVIRGRKQAEAYPKPGRQPLTILDRTACGSPADTGKAAPSAFSLTFSLTQRDVIGRTRSPTRYGRTVWGTSSRPCPSPRRQGAEHRLRRPQLARALFAACARVPGTPRSA
jgi:hypothetical protein